MLVFLLTGGVVNISQGVELVDHDVDIITADAMTLHRDALALICTCDGMELTAADLALLRVEVGGYGINTRGIAYEDHLVGQLLWLQMKMETGTVAVDDQF